MVYRKARQLKEQYETATREMPEVAAFPKHCGGGWYLLQDGRKVRKSELDSIDGKSYYRGESST